MSMRLFFFATLVGLFLAPSRATAVTTVFTYAEVNNILGKVSFAVADAEFVKDQYACADLTHRTRTNHRTFNHTHISYTLPKACFDSMGNQGQLTGPAISAYWDWFYNTPAADGSADVTFNCYSHALRYTPDQRITQCWIDDPVPILQDDYIEADNNVITIYYVGDFWYIYAVWNFASAQHMMKILTICENDEAPWAPNGTSEKNRESGIYYFNASCPQGIDPWSGVDRQGGEFPGQIGAGTVWDRN